MSFKKSTYPVGSLTIAGTPVSEYVIVSQGGEHVGEAARMLAEYLEKACGAFVSVMNRGGYRFPHMIVVGTCEEYEVPAVTDRRNALKNDGVLFYVASDGTLFIDSQSRLGVRYAVSKFLEKFVGVRFLDEETERILPAESIDIPANLDYSYSSPLLYRHTDWGLETPLRRKWGLNGEDGVSNRIIGFCHTMQWLTGVPGDQQPCLSDEAVYQKALAGVRQWIRENPGCRIVSVTQNDNCNYCTCPKCSALAKKENQSGVMLTFVNRLADEIGKEYPGVNLLTFAYQYTRKPPKTIVPRDNVIIWLCSIECCFSHRLDDPKCRQNAEFRRDLMDWGKIAKKIYVWDYTTDYSSYCLAYPNFHTMLPNTRFYLDNNVIAIYEEGGHQQRENGEFRSLRAYMTAQMLWNPHMTQEEWNAAMQDFLEGYYGRGWKYIFRYIQETSKRVQKQHMRIYYNGTKLFAKNQKSDTDKAFCDRMKALWDKAEALAVTDREKRHCAASRIQIDMQCLIADRVATGKPDPDGNRALWDALRFAGVKIMREGGDVACFVRGLDESIMENASPNELDELFSNAWRAEHHITPKDKL